MSQLAPQLIQTARTGCPEGLEELGRLLTKENYSVTALGAALVHLSINDCPKHHSLIASDLGLLRRIIPAIQVVDISLVLCRRTKAIKAATSLRLRENLEGLVAWMSLILKQFSGPRVYNCVGITLLHLVCLDDEMCFFVFSSPEAANLTLSLWRYEPTTSDEGAELMNSPWVPSATGLVHNWITHGEAKQIFFDILLSSKRHLSAFLDAFVFKLRRIIDIFHSITLKGGKIDKYADSLTAIFVHLQRRVVSLAAKRSLCLKELANVSSIILPPTIPKKDFLENSVLIFQLARAHRNLAPIIESGLLEALVDVFPNCEWGGELQAFQGTFIMALVASSACYFRGLQELSRATAGLLENPKLDVKCSPWYCLANFVEQKLDAMTSVTQYIPTCDNVSCPNRISREDPDVLPIHVKVCSGCRFMAYCSVMCQKADWTSQHRFECSELRYISQRCPSAVRISQRTKAFHLTLAKEIFQDPKFQAFCKLQQRSFHHEANNLVAVHDMTYPEFPKKTLKLQILDEWLEAQRNRGLCSAMDSRLSGLVEKIRDGTTEQKYGGISALELTLEWNDECYLSLLVRFEELSEGWFVPTKNVLRILDRRHLSASKLCRAQRWTESGKRKYVQESWDPPLVDATELQQAC
ncbi:hypothetical protein BKA70DRAFT_1414557 [Coprinopsis sp. MPI-PUGE-AT-0042]|nr:hypothetical protein BKA70DRAFT_1414557 [Coprinopsis sp. MPI-PUGE-AT-0042]